MYDSQSSADTMTTIKLADYLFIRLKQLRLDSVHGVPGDYNLTLLDHVEPNGLCWVGNANELNAGYAADGYARIKRMGALITTFGVGELSAINAVAGAYVERAAVVHIVGTPPRESQKKKLMIHHTLGDGDYRHFQRMASHVAVAQVNLLDARTAPEMIDYALRECWLHCRPVYIEVPADMVNVLVLASRLEAVKIDDESELPDPTRDEIVAQIFKKMQAAKSPMMLIDGETRSLDMVDHVQKLVELTRWPTFTTSAGKGLVNMQLPNVYGIYKGSYADQGVKNYVDKADLVLCFGPHLSSINTYSWSAVPDASKTISFTWSGVDLCGQHRAQVSTKQTLLSLLNMVKNNEIHHSGDLKLPNGPERTIQATMKHPDKMNPSLESQKIHESPGPETPVIQKHLWHQLARFLREGDVVLAETGTAAYGARDMSLPNNCRLFTPITWLSIGYMLPAAQGAALAQRELIACNSWLVPGSGRTVLIIGDGSLQMTVQELGTIIRHNLNVVVFVINNDGYTIERCIHGKNQAYNDVSKWRYLKAPELFGAREDTYAKSVNTHGELEEALKDKQLTDAEGLRMLEILVDKEDAPEGPLTDLLRQQK